MTRKEERKNATKDKADEPPTRQTGLRRTQRKALMTRETKKKGRKRSFKKIFLKITKKSKDKADEPPTKDRLGLDGHKEML